MNAPPFTQFYAPNFACHLFTRIASLVTAILICSQVEAQNLYVSDAYSGIYEIAPDGTVSTFATGLGGGMAFDSGGNLFVAHNGGIWKFTPDGLKRSFASGLDPRALALDNAGNLFVTDFGAGAIYKFTPQGERTTFAAGLNSPYGLAFDGAGNLFVTDIVPGGTGFIYKFSPQGARSTFAAGLHYSWALAFDSGGNLFATDFSPGAIYKFTPQGARTTFATGVKYPTGIAFDNMGNLFVADSDTGSVFIFTPEGVKRTIAELPGSTDYILSLALQPTPNLARAPMANFSTRVRADVNANRAISGFVIGGSAPRRVVIRAVGPSLVPSGVGNAISNPKLTVFDQGRNIIAQNDDWQTQIPPASGYATFPLGSTPWTPNDPRESAIGLVLPPGAYTAFADGVNGEMGITLAEIYDADAGQQTGSWLSNISTRGTVMTGESVMIAGFIIGGTMPTTVTIRALGPSLSRFGLTGVLLDPEMTIYDSNGVVIAYVDDTSAADAAPLGSLLPSDPREPAKKMTLLPGAYTTVVSGKRGATGIALIEVYFNQ